MPEPEIKIEGIDWGCFQHWLLELSRMACRRHVSEEGEMPLSEAFAVLLRRMETSDGRKKLMQTEARLSRSLRSFQWK